MSGNPPILDTGVGSRGTSGNFTGTTGTATLTTHHAPSIIFLLLGTASDATFGPAPTGVSVSGAGLTWNLYKRQSQSNVQTRNNSVQTYGYTNFEVWWAYSASTFTSQTITVTTSSGVGTDGTANFGVLSFWSITTTNPFDPNAGLPNFYNASTSPVANYGTISTSNAADVLLYFDFVSGGSPTAAPSGWTQTAGNPTGAQLSLSVPWWYVESAYLSVTSTQTNLTMTNGATNVAGGGPGGTTFVVSEMAVATAIMGTVSLGVPTGLSISGATSSSLTASWNQGSGLTPSSYTLQYRVYGTSTWTQITGITGLTETVSPLLPGVKYEFQVEAVGYSTVSGFSGSQLASTLGVAQVADLWFSPTPYFVDLTQQSNRRLFISGTGGGQNLGTSGQNPFDVTPPVFLTSNGTPSTFATNNGRGGAFTVTGTIAAGSSQPPLTTAVTTTTQTATLGNGVVGDYQTGNLYAFNPNNLTDNGTPRRWQRRWRAMERNSELTERFWSLVIDMQTGLGVPNGTNPHVMLRWSDDGGRTWSDERIIQVGQLGYTTQTVKFNRLGATRRFTGQNRIFELSSDDVFPVSIIGAALDVS